MGTNYYLEFDRCPHCGRPQQRIHLGKNSCGCKFLFQKSEFIKNFEDFKKMIKQGTIVDEYDRVISEQEMLEIIEESQGDLADTLAENIDGYDFYAGDFS